MSFSVFTASSGKRWTSQHGLNAASSLGRQEKTLPREQRSVYPRFSHELLSRGRSRCHGLSVELKR